MSEDTSLQRCQCSGKACLTPDRYQPLQVPNRQRMLLAANSVAACYKPQKAILQLVHFLHSNKVESSFMWWPLITSLFQFCCPCGHQPKMKAVIIPWKVLKNSIWRSFKKAGSLQSIFVVKNVTYHLWNNSEIWRKCFSQYLFCPKGKLYI